MPSSSSSSSSFFAIHVICLEWSDAISAQGIYRLLYKRLQTVNSLLAEKRCLHGAPVSKILGGHMPPCLPVSDAYAFSLLLTSLLPNFSVIMIHVDSSVVMLIPVK